MPVDHDTPARYVAWLYDAQSLRDVADKSGPGWLVSLTICQLLDDEREEEHVEDLSGVVDHGDP